jgi:hypothetical protein
MKTVSIMYHDVIEASDWERSGFPGAGANIYKLHKELFSKHLEFLQASGITVGSVFDADPDQMTVLVMGAKVPIPSRRTCWKHTVGGVISS